MLSVNKLVTLTIVILMVACSEAKNDSGKSSKSNGFSENSVKLSSLVSNSVEKGASIVARSADSAIPEQYNCSFRSDIYEANGSCISPVEASGRASSIDTGLIRLAGPSEFTEIEGALVSSTEFDFFSPSAFVTNNTLRNAYDGRPSYNSISVKTPYYQIKFPLSFNSTTKKWVTMSLAHYSQPFTSSDAVENAKNKCNLSDMDAGTAQFSAMDMLEGLVFKRGDYLFCVKDMEADTCASSDFMWLDLANNSLVSNRPSTPYQSHSLANNPVSCNNDDGRVGFDFGDFGLYANFLSENQFKLWSDFSHGDLSRQWSESEGFPVGDSSLVTAESDSYIVPYYIYYHQECPAGSCTSTKEGSDLSINFIFDTNGMIFVETFDQAMMLNETNIGNILAKVSTKTQWSFDQRSKADIIGYDPEDIGGVSVKAEIAVTRAINNPPDGAIVNCPDDNRC